MKKTFVVLLFLALGSYTVLAQNINLSDPLPVDKTIKKGVLSNGLTYYIHSTDVTKGAASYYIIQNVGSILENDNQQGLAHFLEHMAFNGTENFPGKALLNKMQEQGLVFGRDINAYTSFDETVYNINNVPTTPELIETGLLALRDWCNYLLLTDEEIDAERGVIKEEWRTRQNGAMRIFQKTIGTYANNSKYAERLPIGKMDIVENFEYKALRDFYHDWYRTDLQAIAIIGDVDVDTIEAKIKELFSVIPAVSDAPERYNVTIEDNEEMLYDMAMDKEVANAQLYFAIRHPKPLVTNTVASLRDQLLNSMVNSILSYRFRDLTQQPDAPFINVNGAFRQDGLARSHNAFAFQINPKPNMQAEALKLTMTEINRAVRFGFTNAEIDRVKAEFSNYYENQISKLDDRSHGQIIGGIKNDYIAHEVMTDVAKEYEIVKVLFNQLAKEDLLLQIGKMYTKKNRALTVTGVEGDKNLTMEEASAIINEVENSTDLKPYDESESVKDLMSGVTLRPGKIVSETNNTTLGSTTFELSNGVTVHYKFVDKNKNDVSLQAISDGGVSLVNDEDLPSAGFVSHLVGASGIGDFSAIDLPKLMAGKSASANINIGSISESIAGSSTTKDVETMLQLTNLRFTKPRFDEKGYDVLMQNVDNYLIRKSQDLKSKMGDSTTVVLYGKNHPQKRLFDKAYISEVSFDNIKTIYKSRFGNAADFTFFIVGDVSKEALKPLLEKYIASIPTNDIKENWKDNTVEWIDKTFDKDIFLAMEDPKTSVKFSVKNDMPYSLKNYYVVKALGDILQLRYTESLREEEGGTYGAGVGASLSKEPRQIASLSVSFDCNPDLAEKLIGIVHKEMETIKDGDIQQKDLDKTLASYLKEREESKNYNSYEMSLLKNFVLEGYNMEDPENFENIIKSIAASDIQKIMGQILDNAQSYEIVFKPEQ